MAVLNKLPFTLPVRFAADFGYRGTRRFFGVYWEPCGDEVCCDDGEVSACGLHAHGPFLAFVHDPGVAAWLSANGVRLGDSESTARHWLVVDGRTRCVYAGTWREARSALTLQAIPA